MRIDEEADIEVVGTALTERAVLSLLSERIGGVDVVVLDYSMPGLNGFQVSEAIDFSAPGDPCPDRGGAKGTGQTPSSCRRAYGSQARGDLWLEVVGYRLGSQSDSYPQIVQSPEMV